VAYASDGRDNRADLLGHPEAVYFIRPHGLRTTVKHEKEGANKTHDKGVHEQQSRSHNLFEVGDVRRFRNATK
jgi:hypothetical protein